MIINNIKSIIKKCVEKFPLVRKEFYSLNWREQMAENNQEIHELYKRLDELESKFKKITELKK